jgi:hypothetical protein
VASDCPVVPFSGEGGVRSVDGMTIGKGKPKW